MALKAAASGTPAARTTTQGTAQNAGNSGSAANNPAANNKDTTRFLSVGIGKSVVVDTPRPVKRISVGLGDLAEVTAVSPTEVLINGKTVGETSLILWDLPARHRQRPE
jgi:pilus assembly protein CpaC